jgi:hypothetical protein
LHIPDFILKLSVFIPFHKSYIILMTGKTVPCLARSMERTTDLSIIFSYFVDI